MLTYCCFCCKCIRSKDQLTDEKGKSYCSIECKEKELIIEIDEINKYFAKKHGTELVNERNFGEL